MFNQKLCGRTYKAHTLGYCASLKLCGLVLNSGKRVSRSEQDLKTPDNNPDAYLTLVKGGKTLC